MKLSLVCFLVFIVVTHGKHVQRNEEYDKLCDHPDCYVFAAQVAAGIDETVDPCQDFWKYACGNWGKNIDNIDHNLIISTISLQENQLLRKLKGILSAGYDNDKDPAMITNAKYMYDSCIHPNYDGNLIYIRNALSRFGGWKLGSDKTFGWEDVMEFMQKAMPIMDTVLPFNVEVRSNPKNTSVPVILLLTPDFESEPFRTLSTVRAMEIANLALEIDPFLDKNQAFNDAKDMLWTYRILRNMATSTSSGYMLNISALEELTEVTWLPLFQKMFGSFNIITPEQLVIIDDYNYYIELIYYATTPQGAKNLINYMGYIIAFNMFNTMRNRLPSRLETIVYPTNEESWQICVKEVLSCFAEGLAWTYGQLYHQIDKERKMANEITTLISNVMKKRLIKSDWLDESSRDAAIKKLEKMHRFYEYPAWIDDEKQLTEHYAQLNMTVSIVYNNQKCEQHLRKDTLKDIILGPHDKTWGSPFSVNAFYYRQANNFKIYEGLLEEPYYALNRLRIMNFAELGFTIGHEIIHGFDSNGMQLDADGNWIQLMTNYSKAQFKSKTQCFIDQYDNYTLTNEELPGSYGYQVNGITTLDENIADNEGLRLAYDAYQEYKNKNGKEQMPSIFMGKNFTEPQLFFLFFARSRCGKYYFNKHWKTILDGQSHSANKFRVKGPLSNFDKFSQAYNCSSISPMNRGKANSCKIW